MMGRRPKAAHGEKEISVRLQIDADLSRAFESQCGPQGGRQTVSQTAPFIFSKDLIELGGAEEEVFPGRRGPVGEYPVLILKGLRHLAVKPAGCDRLFVPFGLGLLSQRLPSLRVELRPLRPPFLDIRASLFQSFFLLLQPPNQLG